MRLPTLNPTLFPRALPVFPTRSAWGLWWCNTTAECHDEILQEIHGSGAAFDTRAVAASHRWNIESPPLIEHSHFFCCSPIRYSYFFVPPVVWHTYFTFIVKHSCFFASFLIRPSYFFDSPVIKYSYSLSLPSPISLSLSLSAPISSHPLSSNAQNSLPLSSLTTCFCWWSPVFQQYTWSRWMWGISARPDWDRHTLN